MLCAHARVVSDTFGSRAHASSRWICCSDGASAIGVGIVNGVDGASDGRVVGAMLPGINERGNAPPGGGSGISPPADEGAASMPCGGAVGAGSWLCSSANGAPSPYVPDAG
jgi:hypothetical protein